PGQSETDQSTPMRGRTRQKALTLLQRFWAVRLTGLAGRASRQRPVSHHQLAHSADRQCADRGDVPLSRPPRQYSLAVSGAHPSDDSSGTRASQEVQRGLVGRFSRIRGTHLETRSVPKLVLAVKRNTGRRSICQLGVSHRLAVTTKRGAR